MSRINARNAQFEKHFIGFAGISEQTPLTGDGTDNICNFRINKSGTLYTRNGYKQVITLPTSPFRGIWEGSLDGSYLCFAVAGSTIYQLTPTSWKVTAVGSVHSNEKTVCFCKFKETLFLLDGADIFIYRRQTKTFTEVAPYAPLYGQQWHPTDFGDVYEEINLLTPRLRVQYYNSTGSRAFYLPYYASTVDCVLADGVKTTNYSFTANGNTVTINTTNIPTYVEIGFSVQINTDIRQTMLASLCAMVHKQKDTETLLLYGGDEDYRVYCSTEVSDASINYCKLFYPTTDTLYFQADNILCLGDTQHPIVAMCPFYDLTLAFGTAGTWLLDYKEGKIEAQAVLNEFGCGARKGVQICNGKPYLINKDGVFSLSASISHPEDIALKKISAPIGKLFSDGIDTNTLLFWNHTNDELWLRFQKDTNGSVWVWNMEREEWYHFDNIPAVLFFDCSFGIGFASTECIYLFDSAIYTDNGTPICAYYYSNYMDLGVCELPKRALRACVSGNVQLNEGHFSIMGNRRSQHRTFPITLSTIPQHYRFRFGGRRNRFVRFYIYTVGESKSELYQLSIYANP